MTNILAKPDFDPVIAFILIMVVNSEVIFEMKSDMMMRRGLEEIIIHILNLTC